ncbi:MAG: DNA-directed RNA polymerase subunit beta' [Actinomycetota bacterium]
MLDVNLFDAIRIGIASPEQIRSWSNGEIKKPETINYRTLKPEKDGLFCEKIFGPSKDWECYCGKYKRIRFKGIICERCGVEVTRSKVRRERMGHIELASPVVHIWFFKGIPSRLGYLLDISPKDLDKVIYFASYIVTSIDKDRRVLEKEEIENIIDVRTNQLKEEHKERVEDLLSIITDRFPDQLDDQEKLTDEEKEEYLKLKSEIDKDIKEDYQYTQDQIEIAKQAYKEFMKLEEKQLIDDERVFREMKLMYAEYFTGGMGAEAIKEMLVKLDCHAETEELRKILKKARGQKKTRAIKRLKVVAAFDNTDNRPQDIVMEAIPVIPPDLRPMVQLDGGRFATSDLNDLYRRVINRNNRLKKLLDLGAPEVIVNNEKRMLQESVDALFDNGRRGRPVTGPGNRALKSLSDMLKGKQGRFRQNLLGRRVDYSGRSVIVVNPKLKINQCGIPKLMALELFKPFIMRMLVDLGHSQNIKSAKRMVERGKPIVWDVLEKVVEDHPVLLNRAPTLHRLGVQAFLPILVEGKAIQIHPLVCTAFNADFDGDQMAVHIPLSQAAQAESRILMISSNNLLSPAAGKPLVTPSQDMVLGIYHLTSQQEGQAGEGKVYYGLDEALLAYEFGKLSLQAPIRLQFREKVRKTTLGRAIFNSILPEDYPYIDSPIDKKQLSTIVTEIINTYSSELASKILDGMKKLGFTHATEEGITIGIDDIKIPEKKAEILKESEETIKKINTSFKEGFLADEERLQRVVQLWSTTTEEIGEEMERNFGKFNPIYMMANSGARGNVKQLRQLAGMRGLVADARGEIIDRPIKSNFREGLSVLEYFLSTHGARQGLADTALRTADSGYLTRRLVDVSQDVIVREHDCGTKEGKDIYVLTLEGEPNPSLLSRICAKTVADSSTGEIIIKSGKVIKSEHVNRLIKANIEMLTVRSVLNCKVEHGICKMCYGEDMATGKLVEIGEAVGIIAAQSIGEPGTQLTMRTFHTGGVASTYIQKPIRVPVDGELIIPSTVLKKLKMTKKALNEERNKREKEGKEFFSKNIDHLTHRFMLQVEMDDKKLVDVMMHRGEKLEITTKKNVKKGEIIAKVIQTAKRKKYIRKHEKAYEAMDITAGLPKVVELFEARKPKGQAIISETSGKVEIKETDKYTKVIVTDKKGKEFSYTVSPRSRILVNMGDDVIAGQQLTDGSRNPHDILKVQGVKDTQTYLINEVQNVYKSQGVDIHDKQIEIIVRQMFKKVAIIEPGDTNFLPGQLVNKIAFQKINEDIKSKRKKPATARQTLMGITKAALATDSFLSAASFQETTKVLTDASLNYSVDPLLGIKENVIIGKLIPAGTGMKEYRKIEINYPEEYQQEELLLLPEIGGELSEIGEEDTE